MQGNILTMECAQGVMQIVPYADNILHFVYYPQNDSSCLTEETDGREKLPLWGIKFCSLHPASYRSVVRKIRIIAGFLKLFIIRLVSYWAVRFTRKVV